MIRWVQKAGCPLCGLWMVFSFVIAAAGCRAEGTERKLADVLFLDVTTEVGLGDFRHETGAVGNKWMPETLGGGGGFIDFDDDGWLDVLLVRGSRWDGDDQSAVMLYRNSGGDFFEEYTAAAGLSGVSEYAFGITVADFDGDGDEDFFLTTLEENKLFRNEGGTFEEIGRAAGVAGSPEWSTAAVFFDADNDGHLDLYVGNYVKWSPNQDVPCLLAGGVRSYCTPDAYKGLPGRFYRNNGNGTFDERTAEAGFGGAVPGKTLATAHFDYNDDGHADLLVINDTERDLLYENDGSGTFHEIGVVSGIAYDRNGKARAGMGVDVGVVDSTGKPTVFVTNFAREMLGAYQIAGDRRFVDRAEQVRLGMASMNMLSFGIIVFDADLDGHLDLLTANGHINPEIEQVDGTITYRQQATFYRNHGNGIFEVLDAGGGVWDQAMVGRGLAYGDYDRDGDLDVLLVENGGPVHLWRNEVKGQGFLRVHLQGTESNSAGVGARVDLIAGPLRMTRFAKSGGSYLSASEPTLTFGLGKTPIVDTVRVRWPSGLVDIYEQLEGNREIRIIEGAGYEVVEPVRAGGSRHES